MRVLKEHSILRVNIAVFISQKINNRDIYIMGFFNVCYKVISVLLQ